MQCVHVRRERTLPLSKWITPLSVPPFLSGCRLLADGQADWMVVVAAAGPASTQGYVLPEVEN